MRGAPIIPKVIGLQYIVDPVDNIRPVGRFV